MTRTLLDVTQVSKRYSLRPQARLRDATADTLRELCGLPARQGLRDGEFWALENVDLRIDAGEVIGVIGHNGAGKSTLMNLVSGIILPTTGSISLYTDKVCRIDQGGILSTQETGRENIRMQLALSGVPVTDTVAETEAIAAFADLHQQLDAPVGTYSAGMRSRLGFAIYARLHPDLFLVDEGLGGGDQRFRERFRGFIADYVASGGSMLFAMHDTNMIQTLCDRVLLLDGGRPVLTADATTAIDAYNRLAIERGLPPLPIRRPNRTARRDQPAPPAAPSETQGSIVVDSIAVVGKDGGQPRSGKPAEVVFTVRATQPLGDVVAAIEVSRGEIAPLATLPGDVVSIVPPGVTLRCRVRCLALVPGEYDVRVSLFDARTERRIGPTDGSGRAVFRVGPIGGRRGDAAGRGGLLHLPAVWETAALVDPVAAAAAAFHDDPYPTYERWLAQPGPFYSSAHGAWIVSRHDQVSALFRSPSVSSRTEKVGVLGDTMMAHDPPEHSRLRGLVTDAFSAPSIRNLEPTIAATVDDILDGIADDPAFDFVHCVADILPGKVMTSFLGLPDADLPRLRALAGDGVGPVAVADNMRQLVDYFAGIIEQRRGAPGDDLVSRLMLAHDPGGRVSMTEILATSVLLLIGGYETTAGAIGTGMLQRGVDRERDRAGGGDVGGQRCPPGDGSERLVASRRHHRKCRQSGDPIGSQQRQRHPLDPRAGPLPLDVHHHPAQRQALVAKQQRHDRPGRRRRDRLPGDRATTTDDDAHDGQEPAQQQRMGGHGADHFVFLERSRMKMFRQRISPPWVWSWIGPFSGTDTARS